ncbi:recombinase RecB [Bacillus cereus]|uniref:recombinase family protein n=1 Tax=Bacillus cereus TaxID=1396 RepID=UPI000BFA414F|nr:recombinase family protein [Bacillus cereus]PFN99474.1 recombinase RecB [Bacillus cereus]PFS28149.1 recombinase RecB [Bacillus cereus]
MKTIRDVLEKGKKGAFYARVSSDRQTIDAQRHHVYEFIKNYECEIVEEYVDPGESAFKKKLIKRPQIMALLRDVEQGKYDFVITYADDRLARSEIEHVQIRVIMKEAKTDVILTSTGELYTERDIITQLIRDGGTRYEVERISARTKDAYGQRTDYGQWMGGPVPFGYVQDENTKNFFILEDEKEIVLKIYQLYQNGEGFADIAKILNEQKAKTNTIHWKKERVKHILTNPIYAGYVTFGRLKPGSGNSIEDLSKWKMAKCEEIPPIMTKEEWLATFQMFEKKRNKELPPKQLKTEYVLRDLIYCKSCDAPLLPKNQETRGQNGKKYGIKKYMCSNKLCKVWFSTDELHALVFDSVIKEVTDKVISKSQTELMYEMEQILEKDIKQVKKEIQRLKKQVDNCLVWIKDAEREIDELYNQKKKLVEVDPKIDPLLDVMLDYRLHLLHEIRETEELIAKKEAEMKHIEDVDSNQSMLQKNVLQAFRIEFTNLQKDMKRVRQFLVYLIDKIIIDQNGKTEYILKINLEQ